ERERMRGLFREAAERHALPVIEEDDAPIEAAGTRTTLSWREARGRQADLLGTHGRLADLIAVPRPDRAANLGFNTLYAALMSSGRPVLMCPAQAPTALPGRIALAWNGSMEASRAVAVGLALLRASAGVHILTVGETPEGTTPEALARYLAGHGVVSEIEVLAGSGDIGARLLARAKAAQADLLMMGAYSHSRGRESLFGGASQYVVDHADLPVFLVH
ncbi:MAG: universal stress protein, partial [Pseudomonadota bacterium]